MQEENFSPQAVEGQPNIPVAEPKLKGTFDLIGEVLKVFRRKWKLFVLIQIIPSALILIISAINALTKSNTENGEIFLPLLIIMIILAILAVVVNIWAMCALMLSIVEHNEEEKTWKDYFKKGIKLFWAF